MQQATVSARSRSREALDDYRLATDDLRAKVLQPLAVCVAIAALPALDTFFVQGRLITWWPALALILTGGIVFRLARTASTAAAITLIVSLWLVVTSCIVLRPWLPLAPLYSLIVVSAGGR